MPMVPVLKPFIPQGLLKDVRVGMKYLAQIGNRREKFGKTSEVVSQRRNPVVGQTPDRQSCAQAPKPSTMTSGEYGLGSWCYWSGGRTLWARRTASCRLARLRRAVPGLFLWFSTPQGNRTA